MKIAGIYSFNNGLHIIKTSFEDELKEVDAIISSIDNTVYKTKARKEKVTSSQVHYSSRSLNRAFKDQFESRNWPSKKVYCEYPTRFYTESYSPQFDISGRKQRSFREMDFIKNRIGVEVQLSKYAFVVYDICAKMTIFHKLGFINVGIEIIPIKSFADEISPGISFFEQTVWDLEHRGTADIDIPVLILGLTT